MKNPIQSRSSASTFKSFPTQNSYFSQPQNSAPILVVIDPKVEDYQMLAAGVQEGANVFILDLKRDSIEQITEALAQQPVSELHIVCHGSPGCLSLGNTHLSLKNLDHYSKELQTWSNFLASASVFLYGCNVAFGEVGEAFLTQLHQQTGANIAASANRIGSAQKGGDWKLEFTIGSIEAPLAFTEAVRKAYTSVLVISIGPTAIAVTEGGIPVNLEVGISLTDPLTGFPISTPANATITLAPDTQLDLGKGPGQSVEVIIAAGTAATAIQNVPVLAFNDGITEGDHTGTINTTIKSSDAILSAQPNVTTTVSISDPVAPPNISPTQLVFEPVIVSEVVYVTEPVVEFVELEPVVEFVELEPVVEFVELEPVVEFVELEPVVEFVELEPVVEFVEPEIAPDPSAFMSEDFFSVLETENVDPSLNINNNEGNLFPPDFSNYDAPFYPEIDFSIGGGNIDSFLNTNNNEGNLFPPDFPNTTNNLFFE